MPAAAGRSASTNGVSLQESNKIGSANRTGLLLMWPRKRAEGQQEKWYVRLNPQPSRGPMLFWPGVVADIDIETTWHYLCVVCRLRFYGIINVALMPTFVLAFSAKKVFHTHSKTKHLLFRVPYWHCTMREQQRQGKSSVMPLPEIMSLSRPIRSRRRR